MIHVCFSVFDAAKQNSRAIIFIDDSDVTSRTAALYRYLLQCSMGWRARALGALA